MDSLECRELVELVTAYLDGALTPEGEQQIVTHLATCDGCSAYLAQIKTTIAQLGQLTPEPLDETMAQSLLATFRNPTARSV
ncbi:MAG TPA: zf-HC2 domain-containing protein [Propionibacteriaceae bacterium]|nr:zf-HC2 domain-containing protein [Propionibacteriaceae bacterium]